MTMIRKQIYIQECTKNVCDGGGVYFISTAIMGGHTFFDRDLGGAYLFRPSPMWIQHTHPSHKCCTFPYNPQKNIIIISTYSNGYIMG